MPKLVPGVLCDVLHSPHPVRLYPQTPSEPRCGFSKRAVALLQEWGAPFGSFDILSDEAVRNGLKARFSWPT